MQTTTNMDSSLASQRQALLQSPAWLFLKDTGVLFMMLPYLPHVFLPFNAVSSNDELFIDLRGAPRSMLQGIIFIIEFLLLVIALPVTLILPGIVTALVAFVVLSLIYLLTWPFEGQDIIVSAMQEETIRKAEGHPNERWFFINGCATDHAGLQKNIDLTSKTFGRRVVGIHNKSFGLIGDLLQCLIQRCFNYRTNAVRLAFAALKPLLADPTVSRIVLLGHSQGGIIISLALDQLFAEMPPESLTKLEIYTFGSAASHFSDPATTMSPNRGQSPDPKLNFEDPSTTTNPRRIITYIEHYANEYDMVPRWGVLHCTGDIQSSHYAGSVFVRLGASGHFFNQHYLSQMFPIQEHQQHHQKSPKANFLGQVVATSSDVAVEDKNQDSLGETLNLWRKNSGLELGTGQIMHPHSPVSSKSSGLNTPVASVPYGQCQHIMVFSRTQSGLVVGEKASGKTVRQLSRLWKYLDGASPDDEVVSTVK